MSFGGYEMNTLALINEVTELPIEDRALLAQTLLLSLNKPEKKVDSKWADIANKRLEALRNGTVEAIDGEEVFDTIWQRFNK